MQKCPAENGKSVLPLGVDTLIMYRDMRKNCLCNYNIHKNCNSTHPFLQVFLLSVLSFLYSSFFLSFLFMIPLIPAYSFQYLIGKLLHNLDGACIGKECAFLYSYLWEDQLELWIQSEDICNNILSMRVLTGMKVQMFLPPAIKCWGGGGGGKHTHQIRIDFQFMSVYFAPFFLFLLCFASVVSLLCLDLICLLEAGYFKVLVVARRNRFCPLSSESPDSG